MTPKLVQYFKAAQDAVGFDGGPCARRRACRSAEPSARSLDAALAIAARPARRRMRAAPRTSRPSTPTRRGCRRASITGGVGPIPGATMLERKLALRAAPRRPAAAADARAARARRDVGRDPAAAAARRRRLGRAVHRGQRAACRCAGTGRSASRPCSSRPGMVEVTEPETVIRLDTPAGLVEARVAVQRRPRATAGDAAQRARVPARADRERRRPAARARSRYDMAFGGNFYALVDAARRRAGRSTRRARTS